MTSIHTSVPGFTADASHGRSLAPETATSRQLANRTAVRPSAVQIKEPPPQEGGTTAKDEGCGTFRLVGCTAFLAACSGCIATVGFGSIPALIACYTGCLGVAGATVCRPCIRRYLDV